MTPNDDRRADSRPSAPNDPNTPAEAALRGVRVVDLSRILAGPFATQLLGDLGAEVIKVERPGAGDDTRSWGPPFVNEVNRETSDTTDERGDAAYFLCANRNKLSVAIDFSTPAGVKLVRSLIRGADVVVENFKTGALKRYGLDYESLAAENPRLVYCSITGFGQTGPRAGEAGYDYLIQAAGGLMSITGRPDDEPGGGPQKAGVAVADLFTGLYASNAILAALLHARESGRGQHIDMALLDCQLAMLANQATNYFVTGQAPARMGDAHTNVAPYQLVRAADGPFVLAVGNDRQFARFCAAAGKPELAEDVRFKTNAARIENRKALDPEIQAIVGAREKSYWLDTLAAIGVPCGPVNDVAQAFDDPQAKARETAWTMTRKDGARVTVPASPLRMSETPAQPRRAPPLLGQDTDTVLLNHLGLLPDELARLRADGVIG